MHRCSVLIGALVIAWPIVLDAQTVKTAPANTIVGHASYTFTNGQAVPCTQIFFYPGAGLPTMSGARLSDIINENGELNVHSPDEPDANGDPPPGRSVTMGRCNGDGSFQFADLPDGSYWIVAKYAYNTSSTYTSPPGLFGKTTTVPVNGSVNDSSDTSVELSGGRTKTVTLDAHE